MRIELGKPEGMSKGEYEKVLADRTRADKAHESPVSHMVRNCSCFTCTNIRYIAEGNMDIDRERRREHGEDPLDEIGV